MEFFGLTGGGVAPPVRGVEVHLAGLDEILDAAHVVLADGEMEGGPVVVVRGVHVNPGEEESLQGHLVPGGGGIQDLHEARLLIDFQILEILLNSIYNFLIISIPYPGILLPRDAASDAIKCVELVELDELLSELNPSGRVTDPVQGRRVESKADNVGDDEDHDPADS